VSAGPMCGENARTLGNELEAVPDGLHADVPERVYHQRIADFVSRSSLDLVARSPARYRAWLEGADRRPAPALRLGSAVHMAMLEPERFVQTYVVEPAWGDVRAVEGRTTKEEGKANKDRRDAWRAAHAGATILESADGVATLGMVKAIAAHPTAQLVLLDAQAEVTVVWRDEETGLRCKARLDSWLADVLLPVDLKSTDDAREHAFARSVDTYGYHRQAAHYIDGLRANGLDVGDGAFTFIAAEKEPPYDLAVYQLDAEDVADGRAQNRAAMRTLAECLASDRWPGYGQGIRTIQRPAWARRRAA
jgi:hypothetical protein